jgi:carbamoyltransferase
MWILGISCYYHDAAAALLKDGVVVAAVEEERFTRKKHDSSFPLRSIEFCLATAGIDIQDLDYVVYYEKPFLKFERLLTTSLTMFPQSYKLFRESMMTWLGDKLWVKSHIQNHLPLPAEKILFSEHHVSHAASAFLCSPFKEAAVLTLDGVGEWCTTVCAKGTTHWAHDPSTAGVTNSMDFFQEMRFPHSLGLLYSVFTAFLGFEVNEGEYKVMGMAPYGKPRYVEDVWKLMKCADDGSFQLDMKYFSHHYHTRKAFTKHFEKLFGEPRKPGLRFVTTETSTYDDPTPATPQELAANQRYADIAASIQKVTEEIVLRMAKSLRQQTGCSKLCMAGGVALNSVANFRILREAGFDEIYVQPAAGDSGGALGAALYAYHILLNKPRQFIMDHAAWGKGYSEAETADALRTEGVPFETFSEPEKLYERVCDGLLEGQVIGWHQGRFEWGPRALGQRSILADPRNPKMKDIVNIKIKFREPYRPFAPSVIAEETNTYFELPDWQNQTTARFMLLVTPVRESQRSKLPAITHADGTGRLQTVFQETNAPYYALIQRWKEASGVPVVMNTSFNLKGEPIVNTPMEAYRTFCASGMDALVVGNHLITKKSNLKPEIPLWEYSKEPVKNLVS